MYPFLTLDDETEIVHSGVYPNGKVRVYIETPDAEDCFHHLTVWLPDFELEEVYRYSDAEFRKYMEIVCANAQRIMEIAAQEKPETLG